MIMMMMTEVGFIILIIAIGIMCFVLVKSLEKFKALFSFISLLLLIVKCEFSFETNKRMNNKWDNNGNGKRIMNG